MQINNLIEFQVMPNPEEVKSLKFGAFLVHRQELTKEGIIGPFSETFFAWK